jgi:hypothetical protein
MSTINNTDLFLVSRAGTNYQVTAADVSAFTGGGGGTYTGTLPIVVTGTVISISPATNASAGSMSAADKAKLDGAATIVSSVTGTLPITVATGTTTPLIAINAATTGALGAVQIGTNIDVTTGTISIKNASATDKGVIEIATLAEAATGTDATLALTPSTGVPKDAATMTGAAIISSGTTAQRPATPAAGMLRYNSTGAFWEGRIGSNWAPFDQRFPVVTAVSATVNPEDYVVVTAATQTITLPATPLPGACVTVVVAGTWLDTVVARNGSNIMGLAQDLTLNIAYSALQFTYTDATNGWRVN